MVPILPSWRIKGLEDTIALRIGSPGCLAIQSLVERVEIVGYGDAWFTKNSQKRCRQPGPFLDMNWLEAMAVATRVDIVSNLWGTNAFLHHGLWKVSDFVAPVGPLTSGTIVLGARTPAEPPPSRPFTPGNRQRTFGGNQFGVYLYRHGSLAIYVGKGTRSRPEQHKISATNPGFKAYLAAHPGECEWEFVRENMIEAHALAVERRLIAHYGRRDLGRGTLFNLTDGG